MKLHEYPNLAGRQRRGWSDLYGRAYWEFYFNLECRGYYYTLNPEARKSLFAIFSKETRVLNQAVRRNCDRFPADFMFQFTKAEASELNRSQIVIGSEKHRDPRFPPYAFTEQGVAMLSSVLRSKRAIAVNVQIMRTFVRLRQMMASNADLAKKVE